MPSRPERPHRLHEVAAWLAPVLSLAAASCGPFGGDPLAGRTTLVADDRTWSLPYPSPPWSVRSHDAAGAILSMPGLVAYAVDNDLLVGEIGVLRVATTNAADPTTFLQTAWAAISTERLANGSIRYRLRSPVHPFSFANGAQGAEIDYGDTVAVVRMVAVRLANGRLAVLRAVSVRAIDTDADMDVFLRGFVPAPPSP